MRDERNGKGSQKPEARSQKADETCRVVGSPPRPVPTCRESVPHRNRVRAASGFWLLASGFRVTPLVIALTLSILLAAGAPVFAASRIKDIGHFAGVRSNSLIGYSLVIGLNKTGDKRQTFFTQQTLLNMLEKFGLTLNSPSIRVENIAAVMVTAELDAFERPGSRIDVTVSSIGDAASLQGGILLQTPLLGSDANVYAVAQGALVLGGFSAGTSGTSVTVNHPTVGRVPNGGMVERGVTAGLPQNAETMELVLDRADFTNVKRVSDALNLSFGQAIAMPIDGRSVRLNVPL